MKQTGINKNRCADWINDLIKAVIKSIIILTNNKKSSLFETNFHEEVSLNDFIHKIYIECQRSME